MIPAIEAWTCRSEGAPGLGRLHFFLIRRRLRASPAAALPQAPVTERPVVLPPAWLRRSTMIPITFAPPSELLARADEACTTARELWRQRQDALDRAVIFNGEARERQRQSQA